MRLEVHEIAKICHEANRAYCHSLGDTSQLPWAEAPQWQRESALMGVDHILAHPNATPADSHESWLAVKAADGWTYGPIKNELTKQHPCCVPYAQLPREQRAKDYIFGAIVRAVRDL